MREGKYRLWKQIVCLIVLCAAFLYSKTEAQAAPRFQRLTEGKTYQTTLTGKKKHTLKFVCVEGKEPGDYLEEVNIYLDGKKEKTVRGVGEYYWKVYLCRVGTKKTLLYMEGISDNDYTTSIRIMEYRNKKLRQIADLTELSRNNSEDETQKLFSGWARGILQRVGDNSLTVRWSETGKSTGIVCVDVTYKLAGSRMVQSGSSYALKFPYEYLKKEWTAKESFSAYTKAGGSKVSFRIQPGDRVKPLRLTRKRGNLWFQIRNAEGKKGWFKDAETHSDHSVYFEEAMFAG